MSRLALQGDERAFELPRPMLANKDTLNLSFSGLKTAVRYHLYGTGKQDFTAQELPLKTRADMAASFQRAAIDCVVGKARLALKQTQLERLCVGGGVAANKLLRTEFESMAREQSVELVIADPELCTDNAVMGAIAWEKVIRGEFSDLDADIQPGLLRHE